MDTLSAAHATLLVSALLECFVASGWLLAAAMLPRFRVATLHWAAFSLLVGLAFFGYLSSSHWPGVPVYAIGNMLMVGALALQARGLQLEAGQTPADRVFITVLALAALVQGAWLGPEQSVWRIVATSLLLSGLCAWNCVTVLRCIHQKNAQAPQAPRALGVVLSAPFALASMVFALRASTVLLAPERLMGNTRPDQSISMPGALVWLFISLCMALALLGLVVYQLQRQLSQAATHDTLTGLPNRRAADEFLTQAALHAQRHRTPLSVLMIDIDFFKKVNDQHGHAGGDQVLRTLARLLKNRARASDLVTRWGGEEFLMLLPDTPLDGARDMAEQLRLAVQNSPFHWQQHNVPITISVGAATWNSGPFLANVLIADADSALYRAKNTGRNRVCVASEVAAAPGK